ncbi:copper resistance protein B [Dyella sedimenti]|uniref:copper resistance protein B n=1 Tax=Dyella sedimenti TaxID=2919947 RepID=UPI001FA96AF9|nr:copper resistance protein B [Dyella sedimenti]
MNAPRRLTGVLALCAAWPALAWAQNMDMQDMPMTPAPADAHAGHAHEDSHGDAATQEATPMLPPNDHVAPPPPQAEPSASMMHMEGEPTLGMWQFDRLERGRGTGGDYATAWETEGWWGTALDRLWLNTEGERDGGGTEGRVEALWSHAWSNFWDWQLGARQDFGQGPNRQWAAVGVQGLAPYWFETQATFYAGEQGRTALRVESSHELLFTQRLILEPRLELNFYGKSDPRREVSSGLSDLEAGLRLRYEFSRKFAPYLGVTWTRRFGDGDERPGAPPWRARETTWVAGVRLWF